MGTAGGDAVRAGCTRRRTWRSADRGRGRSRPHHDGSADRVQREDTRLRVPAGYGVFTRRVFVRADTLAIAVTLGGAVAAWQRRSLRDPEPSARRVFRVRGH